VLLDYVFVALLAALGILVLDPGVFPLAVKAGLLLLSSACLVGDLVAASVTARR
jgi:hypothetical protein